jgi:hypothetical protein
VVESEDSVEIIMEYKEGPTLEEFMEQKNG